MNARISSVHTQYRVPVRTEENPRVLALLFKWHTGLSRKSNIYDLLNRHILCVLNVGHDG